MNKIWFGFALIVLLVPIFMPARSVGSQAVPTDVGYPAPVQSTDWAYPAPATATAVPGCYYFDEPKIYATVTIPECTRTPMPTGTSMPARSNNNRSVEASPTPTSFPRTSWLVRASWSFFKLMGSRPVGSPQPAP